MPGKELESLPFNEIICNNNNFCVKAAILDHKTDCLGFRLEERIHVNIIKEELDSLNLPTGPWLSIFKEAIYKNLDPDSLIKVDDQKSFTLKYLKDNIVKITPGQKMAYITDVSFSPDNLEKILKLAQGVDKLFIEAAFLEKDKKLAIEKYHLTAFQAGLIARKAKVKKFTVFHFSPRYTNEADKIINEANKSFRNTH